MSCILIIDDSSYMRTSVKQILTDAGYEVIEAADGNTGLTMADTHQPDLVMLDLLMPNIDGFEVLRSLRTKRNTIPVIIFSSDIQDISRKQCFELGAFDFLAKPPKKEELLKMIKMALQFAKKGQKLILSEKQDDALKEMINIGVGKGAAMLNAILDTHICLEVPFMRVLSQSEFFEDIKNNKLESFAAVNLSFKGDLCGNAELIFPTESAVKLVAALTDSDPKTVIMDSIHSGTLSEIGNIVINAVIGSISAMLDFKLSYSAPNYIEGDYEKLSMAFKTDMNSIILQARARFIIDALSIVGNIVLFLEIDSLDKMLNIVKVAEKYERNSSGT